MADFITGGAIPIDSGAYVGRAFEQVCFEQLAAARWVLLLGPRQHGKTSALVRLRERLREEGFRAGVLDVQRFAGPSDDYASFLRWFVLHLTASLEIPFEEPADLVVDDLEVSLDACLGGTTGDLVMLIDEAAAVPDAIRVRFFGQLRALYNARALENPRNWRRRLSILFAGTFRPEGVIAGDNSPFNVSETVYTEDLSVDQARLLAAASPVGEELAPLVDGAYQLVGGQPYLLQRVLDGISSGSNADDRARLLEGVAADLRHGRDRHVPALLDRLSSEPGAIDVVREIAASSNGIAYVAGAPYDMLPVLGIARADGARLVIRNELYRQVILASPQLSPDAASSSSLLPLVHQRSERFDVVKDSKLRVLVEDTYASGVSAANAGHLRFALAGFGACYEGLLLDFLRERLSSAERASAMSGVLIRGKKLSGQPATWSFEAMIDVAHASGKLSFVRESLADLVRDWRNLIHPAKATREFQPQSDLAPEVNMAVAAVEKLLQALSALP